MSIPVTIDCDEYYPWYYLYFEDEEDINVQFIDARVAIKIARIQNLIGKYQLALDSGNLDLIKRIHI